MEENQMLALIKVVDYLYEEEKKHYFNMMENKLPTEDHIFSSVDVLKKYLDGELNENQHLKNFVDPYL